MTPFALELNGKRPARTRQGFAIQIAALTRALDRTWLAAETKAKGEFAKDWAEILSTLLVHIEG